MPLSDEEDGEGDELVKFDASAFDVSVNYSCSPEKVSIKPACLPNDDFLLDSEEGEEQAPLNTLELATANEEPATTPSYWWIVLCILPLGFVAYLLQHQPPCSGSSHKACTGVLKATLSRDKFHEDNAQCFDTLDLLDAELAVVFALRQFRRRFSPVLNLPSDNFTGVNLLASILATQCDLHAITIGSAPLPLALFRKPSPFPSPPPCPWQSFFSQPDHNNTLQSIANLSCLQQQHRLVIVHNSSQPLNEILPWLDPGQFCIVFPWGAPDRPTLDKLTKLASRPVSIRQPTDGVVMIVTE